MRNDATADQRPEALIVVGVPPENPIRCDSGGPTLVPMVQSANLWKCDDLPEFALVHRSRHGREDESATPSGPDPGEVGPQESIGGPKRDAPSRALALENEELMAQGE